MRAAVRTTLSICSLLTGLEASAIRVEGFVRDGFTRLPVRGALVTLERVGAAPERAVTRMDGHYRFEVRAGERAVIRFAAGDRIPRFVVFDATDVPREWTDALDARLDMRVYPPMAGLDSALLAAPAGICAWSPAEETMVWDTDRSGPLAERWRAAAAAHLAEHPEHRPSDLHRWAADAFDQVMEDHFRLNKWMIAAVIGIIWLVHVALKRLLRRMRTGARLALLLAALVGSVALVVDLADAAGPLRFLAYLGSLGALVTGGLLALDLLFGGAFMRATMENEDPAVVDERMEDGFDRDAVDKEQVIADAERKVNAPAAWRKWLPMVIFFAAAFTLIFEGRSGLENTLEVWSLTGMGAAAGLAAAAVVAWTRSPKVVRTSPRLMIWAGGIWWFVLPMVGVASASFLNRSFMEEMEQCRVWPVVEVQHHRSIQVRVSINGERERLEMPRSIKEQLTTLDSLRCCTRMGLFGHPFVVRVEPIPTGDHPR